MKDVLFTFALVALLLTARILIPKMLSAEKSGWKFGLAIMLFAIYTAVMLIMFYFFCNFDRQITSAGYEVFIRVIIAFLIVNLMIVFAACQYYFTREKRRLTQEEKMKLKDL